MSNVTELMKEHAPDMPSPQDFHSAVDRDRRRCICHEHRSTCDCEDSPEAAFVTRGVQIAAAVIGAPVLAFIVLVSAALLWK